MSERDKIYKAYKKLSTPFKRDKKDEENMTHSALSYKRAEYSRESVEFSYYHHYDKIAPALRYEELRHPVFKYFYHATHCSNLRSILSYGLFSNREYQKRFPNWGPPKTNSNKEIVQKRSALGVAIEYLVPNPSSSIKGRLAVSFFVPFYLIPDSPTMWHFMKDPEYCILAIDISILKEEKLHFIISNGNVVSSDTILISNAEDLDKIDFAVLMPKFEHAINKNWQTLALANESDMRCVGSKMIRNPNTDEYETVETSSKIGDGAWIKKTYGHKELVRVRNAELLIYCPPSFPYVSPKYIDHVYMNFPRQSKSSWNYRGLFHEFGSMVTSKEEHKYDEGGHKSHFNFSFKDDTPIHLKRSCPHNSLWKDDFTQFHVPDGKIEKSP